MATFWRGSPGWGSKAQGVRRGAAEMRGPAPHCLRAPTAGIQVPLPLQRRTPPYSSPSLQCHQSCSPPPPAAQSKLQLPLPPQRPSCNDPGAPSPMPGPLAGRSVACDRGPPRWVRPGLPRGSHLPSPAPASAAGPEQGTHPGAFRRLALALNAPGFPDPGRPPAWWKPPRCRD